jgi:hypothetical protein
MQACGFQIIQALRAMNIVDRPGYLQFDEDDVFDKQVNSIFPDHDPIVSNDHGMLLRDGEPRLAQLVDQCVFIDSLKESSSQRVDHRQGCANDSFGQEVNPVLADIHLRVLRVLRFHFPCLLPAQPCQFVDAQQFHHTPPTAARIAAMSVIPAWWEAPHSSTASGPISASSRGLRVSTGCLPLPPGLPSRGHPPVGEQSR